MDIIAALPSISTLLTWFVYVAVVCIIVWGARELARCAGITIPRPLWVFTIVVVSVLTILLLARAFGIVS